MSLNDTRLTTIFNKNATVFLVYLNGKLFFSQRLNIIAFVPQVALCGHRKFKAFVFAFCVLQRFGLIPVHKASNFYSASFFKVKGGENV